MHQTEERVLINFQLFALIRIGEIPSESNYSKFIYFVSFATVSVTGWCNKKLPNFSNIAQEVAQIILHGSCIILNRPKS